MRLWLAVAAVAVVALVACGSVGGNAVLPTPVAPPTAALSEWATFPSDQTPRPVVLIINTSPHGFSSDDRKIAALCHKFSSGIDLSKSVPLAANVSWATGAIGGYPSISAATALAAMQRPGPGTSEPYCSAVRPLVITGVRFARSEFITDRGTAQIDSWLFRMGGLIGEMSYPALAPSAIWNADMTKGSPDRGSVVSSDGRTLTFSFYGASSSSGPCGADYRGVVAESQAAVAIALLETSHAKPGDQLIACDAMAQLRSVDVPLANRLGGRVVLDETGNVTPVCPSTKPAC